MAIPILLPLLAAAAVAVVASKKTTTNTGPIAPSKDYWVEARGGAYYVKADKVREVIEGLRGKLVQPHSNLAGGALVVNVVPGGSTGGGVDAIAWVGAQVAAGNTVELSLSNSFLISCRAAQAKKLASTSGSGVEISPYNAILQQA